MLIFMRRVFTGIAILTPVIFAQELSFPGITEPFKFATISSKIDGQISVVRAPEGKFVKKGKTILELHNTEEQLKVERSKLIFENKSELNSAIQKVENFKFDYDATKGLFENTKSVSQEELLEKKLEYDLSLAEVEKLKLIEQKEELEYKLSHVQLSKHYIKAPFSGIVVEIFPKAHESCKAQEPLVKVVDISKCRFITYVEAELSQQLKKGLQVTLEIDGASTPRIRNGVIEYISPIVDPSSGLQKVKVLFDNTDSSINPGVAGSMIIGG